ncbi:MAG TPA: DUF6515 family protein [Puia sp.]|nr:DUF6515 family protein [Puia sp.]
MKSPLRYGLIIVLLISLGATSRAQSRVHKKKRRAVHTSSAPIHYRPAGWSASRSPYTRRPVLWEGYRYYTYHSYYAFPYRPEVAADTVSVKVGDDTYYYYAGKFYTPVQEQTGYQLVKAPAGAYVYDLPPGCTQVHAGSVIFLQYNGDYFLPVEIGKRLGYEVVNIEASAPRW